MRPHGRDAGGGRQDAHAGSGDDVPAQVAAIQYEVGEGPCLDAIREHDVFQTDNLANDARWPDFARRAAEETGVASVLAFRLFIEADRMGAFNLFSRDTAAFDAEDRAVGSIFAAHAARTPILHSVVQSPGTQRVASVGQRRPPAR